MFTRPPDQYSLQQTSPGIVGRTTIDLTIVVKRGNVASTHACNTVCLNTEAKPLG
jgi:hypothetical protein